MEKPNPAKLMTLENFWEAYKRICIPTVASEFQVKMMRQAFYAGFISMFEVNLAIGELNISDNVGIAILELIKKEIEQYQESMRNREASESSGT